MSNPERSDRLISALYPEAAAEAALPIHDPLGDPPIPARADIDLTPDPRGFSSIVLLFAENILDDVKVARKVNDRILLISLIENIASLAQTSPAEVAFVIERLNSRVPAGAR